MRGPITARHDVPAVAKAVWATATVEDELKRRILDRYRRGVQLIEKEDALPRVW
jgi:hypothetical protein